MTKTLRKRLFTFVFLVNVAFVYAQQYAYVMGMVDNPIASFVHLSSTKNYFTLEKGDLEIPLDSTNTFSFRVNLDEPQAFTFRYFTHNIALFLAPNDTLKMVFNGQNITNTLYYEGNAAAHNRFLADFQKKYTDWTDETPLNEAIWTKSIDDYPKFINEIYADKTKFFEQYDPAVKKQFSNNFTAFIQQNLTYSRGFHLLNYFKLNGWIKTDNINSSYFSFIKNIRVNDDNALFNTYYLRYLELYLDFERYNIIKKKPRPVAQDVVLEKSRQILTFYRPLSSRLPLFQNPFLSDSIINYLTFNDEMLYLNMASETRIRVENKNAIYEDVFLNVKTTNGKTGWVQQSLAQSVEKLVIEKDIYPRQCIDDWQPYCEFDRFLSGKVLVHAAARDIILGILEDSYEQAETRLKAFIVLNKNYKNYNTLLQTVFDSTMAFCQKGETRPIIPAVNTIEKASVNDKILRGCYERYKMDAEDKPQNSTAAQRNSTASALDNAQNGQTVLNPNQNYTAWNALRQYQPDRKPNVFQGLALNENIPSFALNDINGKEVRQQNLLGKVVYLTFWATWCSPCQTHLVYSQSLMERYADKEIAFVYVSIDDDLPMWKQYVSDNKLKGIQVNDPTILPINFKIQGLPNFLIIDKNGHVAFNSLIKSKATEEDMLNLLLKDKKN